LPATDPVLPQATGLSAAGEIQQPMIKRAAILPIKDLWQPS
jgi:hypothetical protein